MQAAVHHHCIVIKLILIVQLSIYVYVTGFEKSLHIGSTRNSRNARFSTLGQKLSKSRFVISMSNNPSSVTVAYGG